MKLSRQLDNLGTETAFAVSHMAAQWSARGNRVFAFHLGDIGLPPPDAIIQATSRALAGNYNRYCPGAGIPLLRSQLARVIGAERNLEYEAENISVQPGGKPVIGKFLSVVMNPGDEVLYPMPGFPIYRSQIEYQGGVAVPYYYHATADGFELDLESMKKSVTPKTRALIYNNHHNPTGVSATPQEISAIADLAQAHNLWVLSDEAYANIRFDDSPLLSVSSLPGMQERTVILFTCSKQFAMTGWRLGAAIGPAEVIAQISKFNTNAESCTTHFIQQAVGEVLRDVGDDLPSLYTPIVTQLRDRRDALARALNDIDCISVSAPPSGFYIYSDVTELLRRKNFANAETLMNESLTNAGLSFCTGEHFGDSPTTKYIRFAFSSVSVEEIDEGLAAWKTWLE